MAGLSLNPYDLNFGRFNTPPAGAVDTGAGDMGAGYFPAAPGTNPAAAYFQQNPDMATSGMGPALNSAGPQAPNSGLGMNLGTGQLALGALGTIGNLWMAWNANKMAKKQFEFQKGVTNTNLANSIRSYNTALSDKTTSRAAYLGEDQDYIDRYLGENRLRDERKK